MTDEMIDRYRRRSLIFGVGYVLAAAAIAVFIRVLSLVGMIGPFGRIGTLQLVVLTVAGGGLCAVASAMGASAIGAIRFRDDAVIVAFLGLDQLTEFGQAGQQLRSLSLSAAFGLMFAAIPLFLAETVIELGAPWWLTLCLVGESFVLIATALPRRRVWERRLGMGSAGDGSEVGDERARQ
jgi:hypothetical protein